MDKKILVVGSGGREHALVARALLSPGAKVFAAPGNAGTLLEGATNVPIPADDIPLLTSFAAREGIHLTVVGPDNPLAAGIVDVFTSRKLRIFGPTRAAAQIESSKYWAKNFMSKCGIPRGDYAAAQSHDTALMYAKEWNGNVVIKRDGLCFGKGTFVCSSLAEAAGVLDDIFPKDGHRISPSLVLIERRLTGPEVSVHAFCDGKTWAPMPLAKDYKRRYDGGVGPNTGGMGAVAHGASIWSDLGEDLFSQTVGMAMSGLHIRGNHFKGVLYPGVMLTQRGTSVLEFNARFGDPEAQAILRLLRTDLIDILDACVDGELKPQTIEWDGGYAACIVLVDAAYPEKREIGAEIAGITAAESDPRVKIFHGATRWDDHRIIAGGGRVLSVTATGATLDDARCAAYAAAEKISFLGMDYRKDVGLTGIGA